MLVWRPPQGTCYSRDIWAPELHCLDGRFYVYLSADDGCNENHRMYVLEGGADPQMPFALKAKLADDGDRWAIDGTVLATEQGKYLVWSGWVGSSNVRQSLYVARLANPWTLAGDRVRISTPERPWELNGRPLVNEGPAVLHGRDGRLFVVYSASGSWTDDYCLGLLELAGDDPLRPACWVKSREAVFTRSRAGVRPGPPLVRALPGRRRGLDRLPRRAPPRVGLGPGRAHAALRLDGRRPTGLRHPGAAGPADRGSVRQHGKLRPGLSGRRG